MRNSSPGRYLWIATLASLGLAVQANWCLAHEGHHHNEEDSDKQVDSYAVPEGSPEELLDFIRTARERMQPKSVSDARRMFEAREHAANHILSDNTTDEATRLEAVTAKLESMGALMRLGDIEAPSRLEKFIEEGAKTEQGDVGELLSNIRLERKFESWKNLNATDRDQLIADLRAHIEVDNVSWSRVRLLLHFAESRAETDDAPRAANLIRELLPHLATKGSPMVVKQVDMIEGVARRLELVGQTIELAGTTLEGESLDWQQYQGKLVLIDFWATWCPPCIAEMGEVEELYNGYREKGFEVVGVNLDKNRQEVEKLVSSRKLRWRNLFHATPEQGSQHPLAVKYGITSIPRSILVDREGRVVTTRANSKTLARLLKRELGEPVVPQTAAAGNRGLEGAVQQVSSPKEPVKP